MVAEIIAVGTELLLGDIVNTNGQFLAKELSKLGIFVYFQTTVGDNPTRLLSAYKIAFDRSDIVITTGGLGPTEDDLTKEIGAQFFGKKLYQDEEAMEELKSYFIASNFTMTENNKKQAMMPEGSRILKNDMGTAPGCLIEENGKMLFMLPGPPNETIPMYKKQVLPILKEKTNSTLASRSLRISGIGESALEEMIKDLIGNQTNPTIAPYAKPSEVELRVTANGATFEEAQKIMEPTIKELYKRLGTNIYGENEDTLESAIVALLKEKKLTLACAESCTGGLVTARLVNCSGVSAVLREGIVSYSNDAKINRLGVSAETLNKFGAVSKETAIEMAKGVAKTSGADIGISTTGIAGPDGGTEDKPVGTVCLAIDIQGQTTVKEYHFKGDRGKIRERTVSVLLNLLRNKIIDFFRNT